MPQEQSKPESENKLLTYFKNNISGPGIWKWEHYFDIYNSHLHKYYKSNCTILEIGIYSGGSLGMWKDYFGGDCRIIGIDIEEDCKKYANESRNIFVYIGDQEDPSFWNRIIPELGQIDIIIDDGGHTASQQIVSFESLFPALHPDGVYIIEDIHGKTNQVVNYFSGIHSDFNNFNATTSIKGTKVLCNHIQKVIKSIHHYPYCSVIEKRKVELNRLSSTRMGTSWEPFL